ncbi:MAG: hypothetical protein LBK23_05060 [Oscillospiraceae bacterium]|jgi:hypothetical protein|nr:hypothetical protein [Oscillospiraceae bacterium]
MILDYTDEQKRDLWRSWRSCTLAELGALELSVKRCVFNGAFTPRTAKFLKELLAECRERQVGAPQTAEEIRAHGAAVAAELRAESDRRSWSL